MLIYGPLDRDIQDTSPIDYEILHFGTLTRNKEGYSRKFGPVVGSVLGGTLGRIRTKYFLHRVRVAEREAGEIRAWLNEESSPSKNRERE